MSKPLGHFLAFVAMVASVLNAQCAVSCSFASNARPTTSERSSSDHSCCRHTHSSSPMQPTEGDPCHHTEAAADGVRLKQGVVPVNAISLAMVLGWCHKYSRQYQKTDLDPSAAADSAGLIRPSLASILRI